VSDSSDLYRDYVAFKGWEAESTGGAPEEYAALIAFSGLESGRLLDIGFGRGELLDWAKERGFETAGVELIPELVDRARARGHQAVTELSELAGSEFHVITAVDVLEHLSLDQLQTLLREVVNRLAPGGAFVARFPNGQSPFSGLHQHGDLTHVRYLTPGALRQVADGAGLSLAAAGNFRPLPRGLRGLKRRAGYVVRDVIELVLGLVYFGHRVPMDPNVVVVLRRRE